MDFAYGSSNYSINPSSSSPSNYILNLNKISKNCEEYPVGSGIICRDTISAAYFSYGTGQMYILFDKSAFSDDLGKIGNYKNITAINVLNEVKYSVTYKETITKISPVSNTSGLPSEDDMYIKYTINENKDTVINKLNKIRETNKQVWVDKNDTSQGDQGFYLIFTDKGKVQISDK